MLDTEVYTGRRAVLSIAPRLSQLLESSDAHDAVLTSPQWLLAHAHRSKNFPCVVLLSDEQDVGAVLLQGQKKFGMPTGIYKAGALCGRGSVIGPASARAEFVERAARALLRRPFAHTVIVTSLGELGPQGSGSTRASKLGWQYRETRHRLDLSGGYDQVMSRFSYKMRRNFRYYRRRAEADLGCRFIPQLDPASSKGAVHKLHRLTDRSVETTYAMDFERAIRGVPGSFAMGLMDREGHWVSYLAGWRHNGSSFVHWQMNNARHEAASISMVMRNFLVENETRLGMQELVFVGETCPMWSRVCETDICGDFLAVRRDMFGKAITRVATLFSPRGQVATLHHRQTECFGLPS